MNTNIADAWDIRLHNCFSFFSIAFLYYDHLITIDREIKYVWGRPKTLSAYLFLANRYFSFLTNLVTTLFRVINFDLPLSCKSYNLPRQLLLVVNQLLVPILMTLRVSALYGRRSRVLGGMLVLGAAVLGVTGWALLGQQNRVAQKLPGCHIGISHDTSMRLAAAWVALFAYDSIIFVLTLAKTWQAGRKIKINRPLPIIALLLRDGSIYFAVMALANLANILTFYFCGPFLRGGLSTFSNDISVTMMSRLMLNLHETATVGIFSGPISTLGPALSQAEFLDESLAISELLSFQENVEGAGAPENRTR